MEKVRVRMLKTQNGSEDGFTNRSFVKGGEYEVSPDLAEQFMTDAAAEMVDGKVEQKAVEEAPKNKAIEKAPKNKGS